MIIYAGTSILAFMVCFTLSIFVFLKSRRSLQNKFFILVTILTGLWCLFPFILYVYKNSPRVLFYGRLIYVFAVLDPAVFMHFIFILLGINKIKEKKSIIKITYLFCVALLLFAFSPLFIRGVIRHNQLLAIVPGPIYNIYVIFFGLVCLYAFYNIIVAYKTVQPGEKNKLRYLFLAFSIAYLSGILHFMPAYFRIEPFPHDILVIAYTLIIFYAIVRHQLMDIEVLVKKSLVFAALFGIIFGIFVGITMLTQELIAGGRLLGLAISSVLIILTVKPVENFLIQITDKYLFQKKYDYKHLIRDFMDELKTMVLNTTDIAQSTVDFFNTYVRPDNSAIFIHNKFTSQYDLMASSGFENKNFKVSDNSDIVKILADTGDILNLKSGGKAVLPQGKAIFLAQKIELIIPLLVHKELIGFLCLGKKKSDEDYAENDLEVLSDLAGALAISLNNAQLFDERADAEKRALVGTIATGINHEVGNPLNIITIKLDTFRILAKEGMLANKSKEQIIDDVNEIAKVCLESAQRIAEITKQVSEFAKPDKKLVFDKVNINEAIDETMSFLKNGMILDANIVEKKIHCEPVYAHADRGQLKQILFNLIKNASHAVDKSKGRIIVSVGCSNNGEVIIKVIDNGHGMRKEVIDKLFTPFFTTKEPGKGTGLGLALVKIMTERNGGKITVESREGEGTTFTLVFKGGLL